VETAVRVEVVRILDRLLHLVHEDLDTDCLYLCHKDFIFGVDPLSILSQEEKSLKHVLPPLA